MSEAGAEGGVEAGEGVVAGGGQVGVGAGEFVEDGLGEGIPGGQCLVGGLFVADGVAQQLSRQWPVEEPARTIIPTRVLAVGPGMPLPARLNWLPQAASQPRE